MDVLTYSTHNDILADSENLFKKLFQVIIYVSLDIVFKIMSKIIVLLWGQKYFGTIIWTT